MGKETDELIRLASEVAKVRPGREMDMLITAGERKATALLCMALHDIGVPAESFTGSQAGFVTDTNHTNARILEIRPDRVRESLDRGNVPVVGGAQGVSTDRDVTFLGRNGSDVTAVALAHALKADACELYTDVSGVFTADPRVVPQRAADAPGELRRDVGDVRRRLSEAGDAGRGVRSQLASSVARALELHLGAGHLGGGGGPFHGAGHRVRGRSRHVRGEGHARRACPTSRASRPVCSAPSPMRT